MSLDINDKQTLYCGCYLQGNQVFGSSYGVPVSGGKYSQFGSDLVPKWIIFTLIYCVQNIRSNGGCFVSVLLSKEHSTVVQLISYPIVNFDTKINLLDKYNCWSMSKSSQIFASVSKYLSQCTCKEFL